MSKNDDSIWYDGLEINKFDMYKSGYYVFTIEEYDNIQNKYETEIENLKRKLGYERLR